MNGNDLKKSKHFYAQTNTDTHVSAMLDIAIFLMNKEVHIGIKTNEYMPQAAVKMNFINGNLQKQVCSLLLCMTDIPFYCSF